MYTLELSKQIPIEVIDHNEQIILYIPETQVMENIPVIWNMLEQVIQDWTATAKAYPSFSSIDGKDKQAVLEFQVFQQFKPRIFQSLFSYTIFFFMLDNGFRFIYSEFNRINRELKLLIRHNKSPKWTELIRSLWKLRNFTIAHWAGTEQKQIPT